MRWIGHWRDPRPRLAVAGDHIAVTDRCRAWCAVISTERFTEERIVDVAGHALSTIVAVGGSGAVH